MRCRIAELFISPKLISIDFLHLAEVAVTTPSFLKVEGGDHPLRCRLALQQADPNDLGQLQVLYVSAGFRSRKCRWRGVNRLDIQSNRWGKQSIIVERETH
jgi:hypothetical protein